MIAIIGTHGTGKSTLIDKINNEMAHKPTKGYFFTKELARLCPFDVGVSSNKVAQDWIIHNQFYIENILSRMPYHTILDRCCIDQYAYYKYWVGENKTYERYIRRMLGNYNSIYYLSSNPDFLVEDGLRPLNIEFQKQIDVIIKSVIANVTRGTNLKLIKCNPTDEIKSEICLKLKENKRTDSKRIDNKKNIVFSKDFIDELIGNIKVNSQELYYAFGVGGV
jgi:nicotinamide riboside kinase